MLVQMALCCQQVATSVRQQPFGAIRDGIAYRPVLRRMGAWNGLLFEHLKIRIVYPERLKGMMPYMLGRDLFVRGDLCGLAQALPLQGG